jgi:hypothetical protein
MVPHVGRLDCAVTGKGPTGKLSFSNVTKPKAQDREEVVEILRLVYEIIGGKESDQRSRQMPKANSKSDQDRELGKERLIP